MNQALVDEISRMNAVPRQLGLIPHLENQRGRQALDILLSLKGGHRWTRTP